MASNDENLNELDDMFQADNPDDMADFMNMLDSIDMGNGPFQQETSETDTVEEQPEVELDLPEFHMSDLDMADDSGGFGMDMPTGEPVDDSSFVVTDDEEDILKLLDAVGEETAAISDGMNPEEIADESVGELAEMLSGLETEDIASDFVTEQKMEEKPLKKGLIQRLLEKFKKEPTEEELFQQEQEEAQEREWEEQQAEEKRVKKEEAQAKKQAKKAEAEKKKQQKDEAKAAQKAAKEEKKAAARAEKERQRGPVPKSQLVPVKPLAAFVILAIAFSVVILTFTNYRYYSASIDDSKEMFIHQKYKEAYELLIGLDIKKKDEKFFEQVKTVRVVDKELDSYNYFVQIGNYEMALEALIKGIGKYNVQAEYAKELKLEKEMYNLYEELLKELTVRFEMTEQQAKDLYDLKDKEGYEKQIEQIARDAAIRDGILEPVEIEKITE